MTLDSLLTPSYDLLQDLSDDEDKQLVVFDSPKVLDLFTSDLYDCSRLSIGMEVHHKLYPDHGIGKVTGFDDHACVEITFATVTIWAYPKHLTRA